MMQDGLVGATLQGGAIVIGAGALLAALVRGRGAAEAWLPCFFVVHHLAAVFDGGQPGLDVVEF
jgi:hypothetical protein